MLPLLPFPLSSKRVCKVLPEANLLPLLPFPFDRVKQCHESEDKVAQRNVVVQHQLMIDSRGSCITGRLTQPVHVMRAVARHKQFIHSVCTDLVDLVLESCRSCRSCSQCISCRSCGLKLVFLTLSSPQLSYLVHFARLTQTAAIEGAVYLVGLLAQICSDLASPKWRTSRSQSTSSERSP